jgi:hypothetical protein
MLPNFLMPPTREKSAMERESVATSPEPQLTLEVWAQELVTELQDAPPPDRTPPTLDVLVEALAPRLARELQARVPRESAAQATRDHLLTLDELVAELPPAKRPETWKRWLYERTRRGEIPGCVKLGGMLFFEREPALRWLRAGATAVK